MDKVNDLIDIRRHFRVVYNLWNYIVLVNLNVSEDFLGSVVWEYAACGGCVGFR